MAGLHHAPTAGVTDGSQRQRKIRKIRTADTLSVALQSWPCSRWRPFLFTGKVRAAAVVRTRARESVRPASGHEPRPRGRHAWEDGPQCRRGVRRSRYGGVWKTLAVLKAALCTAWVRLPAIKPRDGALRRCQRRPEVSAFYQVPVTQAFFEVGRRYAWFFVIVVETGMSRPRHNVSLT